MRTRPRDHAHSLGWRSRESASIDEERGKSEHDAATEVYAPMKRCGGAATTRFSRRVVITVPPERQITETSRLLHTLQMSDQAARQPNDRPAPPAPPLLRRPSPFLSRAAHPPARPGAHESPVTVRTPLSRRKWAPGPKARCSARLCCATCWPGVCSRVLRRASSACPTDLTRPCSIFRVRSHSVSYTGHPPG